MTILIAIDSGGSRTSVEVSRDGGESLAKLEFDAVLSGTIPASRYTDVLREILTGLSGVWADCSLQHEPSAGFIAAAGFAASTRGTFKKAIDHVVPTVLDGTVHRFGVANDAVALLLGHGAQVAVVAGTGSNVIVRGPDSDVHQSSGNDWVASDFGSGYWIGLTAIRQVSRDFEARRDSALLNAFRDTYQVSRRFDHENLMSMRFRELAVANPEMRSRIARFAERVCRDASEGIVEAQNIVKAEAEDLGDSVSTALERSFDRTMLGAGIRVVQGGSLLGNEFYRSMFENQVNMRLGVHDARRTVIEWVNVRTGIEAATNIARELARESTDFEAILDVPESFRPVIGSYGLGQA